MPLWAGTQQRVILLEIEESSVERIQGCLEEEFWIFSRQLAESLKMTVCLSGCGGREQAFDRAYASALKIEHDGGREDLMLMSGSLPKIP
jgi:hypothetical protein